MRKGSAIPQEKIAYIVEHYHDTSNLEIANALGISVSTVGRYKLVYGLKKDKEYMMERNLRYSMLPHNMDNLNTPDAIAKRVMTRKKSVQFDRMLVRWGLKQKTKIHLRFEPRGKLLQRNRLQRLGYIVDEKNLIAYWTDETHRATRLESIPRGERKGTIRPYYSFAPYGELDKESL